MVYKESPALDRVFQALASRTRRAMLRELAGGAHNISDLAEPLKMTFAGASKHVRVLEEAGLVARTVRGRVHLVRIQPQALASANEWLRFYERFWNERFDALETILEYEGQQD